MKKDRKNFEHRLDWKKSRNIEITRFPQFARIRDSIRDLAETK
jgi:hypothetical protein